VTDKNKLKMGVEVNVSKNSSSKLNTVETNAPQTSPDSPFCIAVLGGFSGRGNCTQPDIIASRRLIEIDRDNFEDVMAAFDIKLNLSLTGNDGIQVDIRELDDFHPDALYEKLETFSRLRGLRRRLKNKNTFVDAAAEMQGWLPAEVSTSGKSLSAVEKTSADTGENPSEDFTAAIGEAIEVPAGNLLDNIIDSQQEQNTGHSSAEASGIDKLIRSIVAPYVEPAADPRQDEMVAMVDAATETHMRDILHHADFQALESAWLSLYFLIKRMETNAKLKIVMLDITKQELQQDLAVDDVTSSAVYKLFCNPAEGDMPWSILLGNYTFSDNIEDALTLASIGAIAQQAGAPFLAAASETLVGCESFAKTPDYEDWNQAISEGTNKAWQILRQSPVAAYIGLALPRFLLRLPYGKKSKPIETFTFEEMPDEHCHECYLWGNAAFVKVELLIRNFTNNGWNMQPGQVHQTDNLPVHYYDEEGETVCKPVAEILLTERGGEIISNHGFMSLWSVRNMDSIRSADFRSVNENGQKIIGRWV
jgi:type VI secretion system protein ImpC